MGWTRLDDEFPWHPKVRGAGPLAACLHVMALCYCNRYLTDGLVPKASLTSLLDLPRGQHGKLAKVLMVAGLWEQNGDGYQIHDFLKYNDSKAVVEAKRLSDSFRKGRGFQTDSEVPRARTPIPSVADPFSTSSSGAPDAPIPEQPLGDVLDEYLTEEMLTWAKTRPVPSLTAVEIHGATEEYEHYWQQRPEEKRTLRTWRDSWCRAVLHKAEVKARQLARAS